MINLELLRFGEDSRPNVLTSQPFTHKEFLVEQGGSSRGSHSADERYLACRKREGVGQSEVIREPTQDLPPTDLCGGLVAQSLVRVLMVGGVEQWLKLLPYMRQRAKANSAVEEPIKQTVKVLNPTVATGFPFRDKDRFHPQHKTQAHHTRETPFVAERSSKFRRIIHAELARQPQFLEALQEEFQHAVSRTAGSHLHKDGLIIEISQDEEVKLAAAAQQKAGTDEVHLLSLPGTGDLRQRIKPKGGTRMHPSPIQGEAVLAQYTVDSPQTDGFIPQEFQFASNRRGAESDIALLGKPLANAHDSLLQFRTDLGRGFVGTTGAVGQARGTMVLESCPPTVEPLSRMPQSATDSRDRFSCDLATNGLNTLKDFIIHLYTLLEVHWRILQEGVTDHLALLCIRSVTHHLALILSRISCHFTARLYRQACDCSTCTPL
jgi:hypothetical protein